MNATHTGTSQLTHRQSDYWPPLAIRLIDKCHIDPDTRTGWLPQAEGGLVTRHGESGLVITRDSGLVTRHGGSGLVITRDNGLINIESGLVTNIETMG